MSDNEKIIESKIKEMNMKLKEYRNLVTIENQLKQLRIVKVNLSIENGMYKQITPLPLSEPKSKAVVQENEANLSAKLLKTQINDSTIYRKASDKKIAEDRQYLMKLDEQIKELNRNNDFNQGGGNTANIDEKVKLIVIHIILIVPSKP